MDLVNLSENIDKKIRLLVEKLDQLEQENSTLKHETAYLKQELTRKTTIVNQLEDKFLSRKDLANRENPESPDWTADLKQQLDYYISELDRCIAWLENE